MIICIGIDNLVLVTKGFPATIKIGIGSSLVLAIISIGFDSLVLVAQGFPASRLGSLVVLLLLPSPALGSTASWHPGVPGNGIVARKVTVLHRVLFPLIVAGIMMDSEQSEERSSGTCSWPWWHGGTEAGSRNRGIHSC